MSAYVALLNIDMNLPKMLIAFVGYSSTEDQNDFEAECKKYISQGNKFNFLKLIFDRSNYVFETFSEEDIESFIQASISVLYTTDLNENNQYVVESSIDLMVNAIINSKSQPRLRLKALLALLNLVTEVELKYGILQVLLSYALETKNAKLISHFHHRLDDWIKSWNLDTNQKRYLYQTFSELLSADGKGSLSLTYLIHYFDTFAGEKYPIEVEAVASKAIVSAIKSPVSSFTDRTALLQSFKKQSVGGDLGLLIRVLDIVCTGKLQNFVDFEGSNGYFLSRYNIDPAFIRYNIRIMTLCSLACEKTNLTYKEIASSLEVSEDEVEIWIVDCVGQGLMHAQMDQMTNTVCVSRSAHRSFGLDQWKILQDKLKVLKNKVASVQDAVKKHTT